MVDEALRMGGVGGVQDLLAGGVHGLGLAVVDRLWREQTQARVAVLCVVPGEERLTEGPRGLDPVETGGEVRPVLERLELRLRLRIVVRDVGAGMGQSPVGKPLVMPKSASRKATGLDVMELPRSAWSVSCPAGMPCLATVWAMRRSASTACSW